MNELEENSEGAYGVEIKFTGWDLAKIWLAMLTGSVLIGFAIAMVAIRLVEKVFG